MESRTKKSAKNLVTGFMVQFLSILLGFISRKIFIVSLGTDYLGINGLFTNILSILSLADMGISTAIIYSLYKPIADRDSKKIAAIIGYYKKLYFYIACIVASIGMAIFPFLDFFINLDTGIPYVRFYYLLYLASTVSSYLMVYKTSILTADQKDYIINKNQLIGNFILSLVQIFVLIFFKNYTIYLAAQIAYSIGVNFINSKIAEKKYPYILEKHEITKDEKHNLWVNIKSMFVYKVGGVILNNTDNLLISKLVSTSVLGVYSNYTMITTRVSNMLSLIFTSMQASLGNLNVNCSDEKKYGMFKVISLVEFWVYSLISIGFVLLINDFITLWIGSNYLLDKNIVYIVALNFYFQGVLYPIWCYRNTTGLFKDTKYLMIYASIINLILSIIGGKIFGLFGILAATAIARLSTNMWYEPYKLFKIYFHKNASSYYIAEVLRLLFIIAFIACSEMLFGLLDIKSVIITFIVKLLWCIIVPNVIYLVAFYRTQEFKYILSKVKEIILKKKPFQVLCKLKKL